MKILRMLLLPTIVVIVLLAGCSGNAFHKDNLDQFSWLQGNRVDTSLGFFESWERPAFDTLHGNGYQIKDGDTIFGEMLSIEKSGNTWVYMVNFGSEKTIFRLVNEPGDSIVFENPQNQFPKRITYLNKGNGDITAIIENPGTSDEITRFNFTPVK